jgi:polyisoprenoid-binding protein YceI
MKKAILLMVVVITVALSSYTRIADDTFTVDTEKSTITWIGRKVTGQHTGTIRFRSGSLIFDGNSLKGGSFVADMTTLTTPDGDRLITHLKSEDFFNVDKHPTSTLTITHVSAPKGGDVTISGTLTIKGTSNTISFPATVKRNGNTATATAKAIKVDRAKYDIRYGSKSFFASIGDKAIDDEFELGVNLVATKK